jgi:hypothetical protein
MPPTGNVWQPQFGYEPSPAGTTAFVSSLQRPTMAEAGPHLTFAQRDTIICDLLVKLDPNYRRLAQPIGSCVGWGWSLATQLLAVCDILVRGEREQYPGRILEAATYGFSRVEARNLDHNYGGDGSYGAAAARAVTKFGSLITGRDYNGKSYKSADANLERDWGRNGVPNELEPFAAQHRVQEVTLVRNFGDVCKAICNGYPVAICSNVGFKLTFSKDTEGFGGWLTRSGSWSHCQMIGGVMFGRRPCAVVPNSWADCYTGPVDERLPPAFQKSAGKVDADVIDAMLGGDRSDSFALAGYAGFAPSQLSDWTGGVL